MKRYVKRLTIVVLLLHSFFLIRGQDINNTMSEIRDNTGQTAQHTKKAAMSM